MRDESDRLDGLLDNQIDGALASYTPREPRPGLEQRILASVAAAEILPRHSTWNWRPVWTLAATAVLLAAVAIAVVSKSRQPEVAVVEHHPVAEAHRSPNPIAMQMNPAPGIQGHPARSRTAEAELGEPNAHDTTYFRPPADDRADALRAGIGHTAGGGASRNGAKLRAPQEGTPIGT
jgi:hypothetical protein